MTHWIIANWKMQLSLPEAVRLARAVGRRHRGPPRLVLCPSFPALPAVGQALQGSSVWLGAQNCARLARGSLTGEVSPLDLRALGVRLVILGHSDRRALGETDGLIAEKVTAALRHRLVPVVCVGETLRERRLGRARSLVRSQVQLALSRLTNQQQRRVILTYEPVWAISPARPIAPSEAQRMARFIWDVTGWRQPLLYGGSVTPGNLRRFVDGVHFAGALVGKASLRLTPLLALLHA